MTDLIPASDLASLAEQINLEHVAVGQSLTEGLEHARRAGELLLKAKALVSHGDWLPWLAANCTASERSAQGYMRIARRYSELAEGNPQRVADLSLPYPARTACAACAPRHRSGWP